MYRIGKKIITIVVIMILVASGLTVVLGQGSAASTDNNVPNSESPEETTEEENVEQTKSIKPRIDKTADWRAKLTDSVSKRLDDRGKTTVRVATKDVGNLNRLLKQVGGTPHISIEEVSSEDFDYSALDYETGTGDVTYRNIDIPTKALDEVGQLEGVQKVTRKPKRELDSVDKTKLSQYETSMDFTNKLEEKGIDKVSSDSITNPMTRSHDGPEAWDQGYRGEGIKTGIVDTGTDFSQADLVDQWATADDGNYSDWPLMFSPGAMEYYLALDYPNGYSSGASTGYSQTNFTITETGDSLDVNISKIDFDTTKTYNISNLEHDSVSNDYKFGVCKAPHLTSLWGERVGMLIVDSQTAHEYDTVYVDIDNDMNFNDEKPVNKSSPLAFTEVSGYSGTTTSESLRNITNYSFAWQGNSADEANIGLSAGLLYWIADGNHSMPYADRFAEMMGYGEPPVPGDGNMTAFYHDWGSHGTATASNAAGTGRSGEINSNAIPGSGLDNFTAKSLAPAAEVMGVAAIATPLGGSIQAGWSFLAEGYDGEPGTGDEADISSNSWGVPSSHNSGWFSYDRLAMSMNDQYPETLIISAAGNEGNGYGSIHSPGSSPGVLSVGAGVNYGYRNGIAGSDGLAEEPSGDIIGFSGRGPNSMGQPGVDVYATGEYAWSAFPVSYSWTYRSFGDPVMGWQVYEAISSNAGVPIPHNNTHDIYMFSGTSCATPVTAGAAALAYEAYHDTHGAAPSNDELKRIMMASADDNGYNPTQQGAGWINASMAVKLAMESEGAVADQDFWSPGDYEDTSHRGMANLMEPGESDTLDFNVDTFGGTSLSDVSGSQYAKTTEYTFTYDQAAYEGMANITTHGIYNATGAMMVDDPALDTILNTDDGFVKAVGNLDQLGPVYGYAYAQFFNWKDTNGNGTYDGSAEHIRMTRALQAGNYYLSANIHNPADRVDDGLIMQSGIGPYYTFSGDITLQVYEKASVDWLNVTAGTGGNYTANVTVPTDAPTGGYEGAITYTTDGGQTGIIPVFVNVAGTEWPAHLGGDSAGTSLYSNNAIGAHNDYYDNRYFYIDYDHTLESGVPDRNFVGFLQGLSGTSSLSMNLYGVASSGYTGGEFGDFTMKQITSSETSVDPTKLMIMMTEYINQNPDGLFMVEVRCTAVGSGVNDPAGEPLDGSLGHVDLDPLTFNEYNRPNDQHQVNVDSNIEIPGGMSVLAPKKESTLVDDAPIQSHPYSHSSFVEYLADAPDKEIFDIKDAFTFSFECWGNSGGDDYDLGLFKDENGDGEAQVSEFVKYSGNPGANEKVEMIAPADGTYIVTLAGYTVDSGLVDWEMAQYVAGDTPFGSSGGAGTIPTSGGSFNVTWDIPKRQQTGYVTSKMFASPAMSPTALMQLVEPYVYFDYRAPRIRDMSASSAGTNETYTFKAEVSDNLGIDHVDVSWAIDGGTWNTAEMTFGGGNSYAHDIHVPITASNITYRFTAYDLATASNENTDNVMQTMDQTTVVKDTKAPTITDNSDTMAGTGDDFRFNVEVDDNTAGIGEVYGYYSTDVGEGKVMLTSEEGSSAYTNTVTLSDEATEMTYYISATDEWDNYAYTDDISMNVDDTNEPEADAGSDITVDEGEEFTLDASGSMDNVGIENYEWTVNGKTMMGKSVTTSIETPGNYTADLMVEDGGDNTDTDSIAITVNEIVTPDVDTTAPDAQVDKLVHSIMKNDTVTFDASNSTDNEGIVDYTWTIMGEEHDGAQVQYTFDQDDVEGTHDIELTVRDDAGNEDTITSKVTVKVVEDVVKTVDTGDGDDTGDGTGEDTTEEGDESNYNWALALLVIIVAVIAAIAVMASRKKEGSEEFEEEGFEEETFGEEETGEQGFEEEETFGEEEAGEEELFEEEEEFGEEEAGEEEELFEEE